MITIYAFVCVCVSLCLYVGVSVDAVIEAGKRAPAPDATSRWNNSSGLINASLLRISVCGGEASACSGYHNPLGQVLRLDECLHLRIRVYVYICT